MSYNTTIAKNAGLIGILTLISRILGFARDLAIAFFLGAGLYSDIFFVAFKIPDFMRKLFSEGSLISVFVPVFSKHITNHSKTKAFELAAASFKFLSVILIIIIIPAILLSPLLVDLIAPGFSNNPEKFALTVSLLQTMLPYIFFISLSALSMAILNVCGHFLTPAIAPSVFNIFLLIFIAGGALISSDKKTVLICICIGVLAGGIAQFTIQIPPLIKKGIRFSKKTPFFHPELKKAGAQLLPATIGSAAHQINIFIGIIFASTLQEGSVSYLYFADRIMQFPLGIFTNSIITATFPTLSKYAGIQNFSGFSSSLSQCIKLTLFAIIPATTGLIILREPIVSILFQHGEFNLHASKLTSSALLYYSTGLCAFSISKILASVFYALNNTKPPFVAAFISILSNIFLCFFLTESMRHSGIALAASISSTINALLLLRLLKFQNISLKNKNIISSVCKIVFCSIIMGIVLFLIKDNFFVSQDTNTSVLSIKLLLTIFFGTGLFFALSFLINKKETCFFLGINKKKYIHE